MARIPQVTRTIITTKANVLCMDITKGEPLTKEVILPRTYADEKALMKAVRAVVDNDEVKAVHVQNTEVVETLYGMTEQEFIEHAKILPPRGKETEAEATEAEATTNA